MKSEYKENFEWCMEALKWHHEQITRYRAMESNDIHISECIEYHVKQILSISDDAQTFYFD